MTFGFVTLVGAGPGRLEYLTLAGYSAIQKAQVILYDALLSDEFLDIFPPSAIAVFVGKRKGRSFLTQSEINDLIVKYVLSGKSVVRLKGGDPFIFGRGAEEIEVLRSFDIPYRVIPGVSALNGVAADFALPLTSRTSDQEFRAIQGHILSNEEQWWIDLARYAGTLVIFMGVEKLSMTLEKLCHAGKDPQTPVAVIESDSHGNSFATRASIQCLLGKGFSKRGAGPAIVYLGENVKEMDLYAPFLDKYRRISGESLKSSHLAQVFESYSKRVLKKKLLPNNADAEC